MNATSALIESRKLSVAVPTTRLPFARAKALAILVDVSVAIHPGEIVCMVGESGSGKTTFGRALLGLIRPSAGAILRLAIPQHAGSNTTGQRAHAAFLSWQIGYPHPHLHRCGTDCFLLHPPSSR